MSNVVLSLCMPTNGVAEWVFPVLDSIFSQNCDSTEFEVVITDNGNNVSFKKGIAEYIERYSNIKYFETTALPFLNEIESYKRASGELIKFVNHRTKLTPGTLSKLINYAKQFAEEKPVLYFTNGELNLEQVAYVYTSFDTFVRNLSYWSSWSTGMTIWKQDFEKLPPNIHSFNELFPHTDVLFAVKNREKYMIDNSVIFDELPQGKKPKGNYDLFFAFGVEYPAIILNLYRCNSISADTFKKVVHDNLTFIAGLYFEYFVKKTYCSYDLSGIEKMYDIFYTRSELKSELFKVFINKCSNKIKTRKRRKNR